MTFRRLFAAAVSAMLCGTGGAGASPAPDDGIAAMVSGVSPARLRTIDETLVGFGTRNLFSESLHSQTRGVFAARDWIRAQFERIAATSGGRMTVAFDEYLQPKTAYTPRDVEVSSVIATLRGTDPSAPVYVMSSHYDSRNSHGNDATKDAPGADDNGSAVSAVLEAARVMAPHRFRSTILFAAYDGEEQGLFGSAHHAKTLHDAQTNVGGDLNNDIVGASTDWHGHDFPYVVRLYSESLPAGADVRSVDRAASENDAPSRELARFVQDAAAKFVPQMHVELVFMEDRFGRGGDQQSFTDLGYPGVRFVEPYEDYNHQHQDVRVEHGVQYGDLPQFEDFAYLARVTQVNVAALASLADSPDPPQSVQMNANGFCFGSELRWNASAGRSYEVLWRPTTAADWEHVVPVGTQSHVFLRVDKDHALLAVRSVDAQGRRSVAIYPALARPKGTPGLSDSLCHTF